MGNRIGLEKKKVVIRIMRMDGQILHYQPPLKVQQVLNEFPGHSISDALPAITYLDPAMFMRRGRLYYLLPPENQIMEAGDAVGVVRVKLVVTKQQLKDMLSEEHSASGEKERPIEWRPTLESIPEGNDFY